MWKLAGMPYKELIVAGTTYPSNDSSAKTGAVWLFLTYNLINLRRTKRKKKETRKTKGKQ